MFYSRLPTSQQQQRFLYGGTASLLPPHTQLVMVDKEGELWRCTGTNTPFCAPVSNIPSTLLEHMLVHLPENDQWAVHRATVPDNAVDIAHAI
jgi:hypothetical protein